MKENDLVAKYEGEGGIRPYLKSRSRQKEKEKDLIGAKRKVESIKESCTSPLSPPVPEINYVAVSLG